jgi:hypothetical protein
MERKQRRVVDQKEVGPFNQLNPVKFGNRKMKTVQLGAAANRGFSNDVDPRVFPHPFDKRLKGFCVSN